MEHYVTLFNSLFLPQGIALHASMEKHAGEYTLWVLCVDDFTYDVLKKMSLPNTRLLKLSDLETNELQRVKNDRTVQEYCWTLTPFTSRFVFEADSTIGRVTYLDADMWLLQSPRPIFMELEDSGKAVLITEHGYAAEYDQSASKGRFCVQLMTVYQNQGEAVRKWWEDRCLEWCYARVEDGKFGDQKYLDDWPTRFQKQVHVLTHQEWILAPWNSIRYPYGSAIWHHFHDLRIASQNKFRLSGYAVPQVTIDNIYNPYIGTIQSAMKSLKQAGNQTVAQCDEEKTNICREIWRKFRGLVNHQWRYHPNRWLVTR